MTLLEFIQELLKEGANNGALHESLEHIECNGDPYKEVRFEVRTSITTIELVDSRE